MLAAARSSHVRNDFANGGVCRDSICQVRVASAASLKDVAGSGEVANAVQHRVVAEILLRCSQVSVTPRRPFDLAVSGTVLLGQYVDAGAGVPPKVCR